MQIVHDLRNGKRSKTPIKHGDYVLTDVGMMQARGDGQRLHLYPVHNEQYHEAMK